MAGYERDIHTNRLSWNQRVPIHLRSCSYGNHIATLRAGGCCIDPMVAAEVGEVSGRSLLHLQCHIGHDTLSWARRGARVTGLDFSPPAIEAARRLNDELRLDARFVCADVYGAPAVLDERFDIVFASYGVFCWIPDLPRWMKTAATMLNDGGVLYVMDGHPFSDVFDDLPEHPQRLAVAHSYFNRGPHRYAAGPSYAGEGTVAANIQWTHTLGDFVNAVIGAGLRLEFLHEHPQAFFRRFEAMEMGENNQWRLPGDMAGKVPLLFSLRARRDYQ